LTLELMPRPAPPRPRDIDLSLQVLSELRQCLALAAGIGWTEAQIALKPSVLALAVIIAREMQPRLEFQPADEVEVKS
jgi:hypothetical protein